MQPRTAEQIKAQLAALQGRDSYDPNTPLPGTGTPAPTPVPGGGSNLDAIISALTDRLTDQASGISTSATSQIQNLVGEAIAGTQEAGELGRERLQSERTREVNFALDRQDATITGALEGRRGYGTQVIALRELTETTSKEVKDLDQRYQEAILANDAATAQRVADLRIKKLEFLQEQEQNFYNNIFSLANLQQEAQQMAMQNDQFLQAQAQRQRQFEEELKQSQYEYEQNYGLDLERIALQERELDIQLERNQISWAEYNLRKGELSDEKDFTNLQAIITQDMRNQIANGASLDDLLGTDYMARMFEQTGFEGSSEQLSRVIRDAYNTVSSSQPEASENSDGRTNQFTRDVFTNETTPMYPRGIDFTPPAPDGFLPANF